ncbi:MAG: phospholipase D-like domain-containing protein [Candidatus Sericytochromatia bacterium]
MNFGEEYEKVWHDSMTEFQGEVVQDMQREFFINWKKSGGEVPANPPSLVAGKIYGNTPMRVTVTTANEQNKRYQIKDSILTLIDNAKDKITFFGAYFSDDELIKHLIDARKKGVDVEVIMPKKGDSKIFDKINPATARDFLKNNVKVMFYQPRFSHIKTAIIDKFTIVGSANPDARSFRENQELNVIIENEKFREDVQNRLVNKDISLSTMETLDTVKVSLGKRIAQTFLEIVDYYL